MGFGGWIFVLPLIADMVAVYAWSSWKYFGVESVGEVS